MHVSLTCGCTASRLSRSEQNWGVTANLSKPLTKQKVEWTFELLSSSDRSSPNVSLSMSSSSSSSIQPTSSYETPICYHHMYFIACPPQLHQPNVDKLRCDIRIPTLPAGVLVKMVPVCALRTRVGATPEPLVNSLRLTGARTPWSHAGPRPCNVKLHRGASGSRPVHWRVHLRCLKATRKQLPRSRNCELWFLN